MHIYIHIFIYVHIGLRTLPHSEFPSAATELPTCATPPTTDPPISTTTTTIQQLLLLLLLLPQILLRPLRLLGEP